MRGGASCPRYGGGGLDRADHVPRGDSERGDGDRSRSGAGHRLAQTGREWQLLLPASCQLSDQWRLSSAAVIMQ